MMIIIHTKRTIKSITIKKALETDNHCLFCTTVPNFDINQYKSILNNVGENAIDKGLSENTMAYTKKF